MAAAVAMQNGMGGQNLDVALMLAAGSAKGSADPALDAHILPIGDWAKAVWEGRLPRHTLTGMIARAKLKLVKSTNVWSATGGPAIAVVATCERIGWTVIDSQHLRTDDGVVLDLGLDPRRLS